MKFKVGDRVKWKELSKFTGLGTIIYYDKILGLPYLVERDEANLQYHDGNDCCEIKTKEYHGYWVDENEIEIVKDLVEDLTKGKGARSILADLTRKEEPIEKYITGVLPSNEKEKMTLAQELFDRFLKSNKTKVIESFEKAEEIHEEIKELLSPLSMFLNDLRKTSEYLQKSFDSQEKDYIKKYLNELTNINKTFDDKLFDQLKTILKSINKILPNKSF